MNNMGSPPTSKAADFASLVIRVALGVILIYMGAHKVTDPAAFLKLVRQYNALHDHVLLNFVAATLPWFEVFCGALLILGVAVRGAALNIAVLLAVFTVLIYFRGRALSVTGGLPFCAVKFDCGCGSGEVMVCRKLAENTGLFLMSLWLVVWRPPSMRGTACGVPAQST
jgi:uncharacterized membrane protein YphA (DoxX/SURF4 family)